MSVPCDAQTFGSLLRAYRRTAGLTQEALAERSGVSTRAIQHRESTGIRPGHAMACSGRVTPRDVQDRPPVYPGRPRLLPSP